MVAAHLADDQGGCVGHARGPLAEARQTAWPRTVEAQSYLDKYAVPEFEAIGLDFGVDATPVPAPSCGYTERRVRMCN